MVKKKNSKLKIDGMVSQNMKKTYKNIAPNLQKKNVQKNGVCLKNMKKIPKNIG